jgi:3-hydroxyisobutyrate dehydrogenase
MQQVLLSILLYITGQQGKNVQRKVGIIGLGHMGRAVARKLHAAGDILFVFNRTRSKAESLLQLGARITDSPRQLADNTDVTISLVSDDKAMESIAFGDNGFISGVSVGKFHIDMSTLSESMIERVDEAISDVGGHMVHAPILGGPLDVFNGTATICAGGPKATVQAVLSLLESISRPVYHVGELTHGTRMKLALNIMLTHLFTGIASSLAFARKGDLPEHLVHDILTRISSGIVHKLGEKMLSGDRGITFTVANLEKDQRYFLDAARNLGLELPTIEAARKLFRNAIDVNMAQEDFTSIYHLLLKETGNHK